MNRGQENSKQQTARTLQEGRRQQRRENEEKRAKAFMTKPNVVTTQDLLCKSYYS